MYVRIKELDTQMSSQIFGRLFFGASKQLKLVLQRNTDEVSGREIGLI